MRLLCCYPFQTFDSLRALAGRLVSNKFLASLASSPPLEVHGVLAKEAFRCNGRVLAAAASGSSPSSGAVAGAATKKKAPADVLEALVGAALLLAGPLGADALLQGLPDFSREMASLREMAPWSQSRCSKAQDRLQRATRVGFLLAHFSASVFLMQRCLGLSSSKLTDGRQALLASVGHRGAAAPFVCLTRAALEMRAVENELGTCGAYAANDPGNTGLGATSCSMVEDEASASRKASAATSAVDEAPVGVCDGASGSSSSSCSYSGSSSGGGADVPRSVQEMLAIAAASARAAEHLECGKEAFELAVGGAFFATFGSPSFWSCLRGSWSDCVPDRDAIAEEQGVSVWDPD